VELFARIVVGVDGTEWGLEALRQALTLAPENGSTVEAVTALDTAPAVWTGFEASYWVGLLDKEAQEARDEAAATLTGRVGSARVVEGRPVPVLREARDAVKRRYSPLVAGTAAACSESFSATLSLSSCTTGHARCSWHVRPSRGRGGLGQSW
jgi:nucleotide-binding universal stress UspA family protein